MINIKVALSNYEEHGTFLQDGKEDFLPRKHSHVQKPLADCTKKGNMVEKQAKGFSNIKLHS